MTESPLKTAVNGGRDQRGRFSTGNQFARGNPVARKTAAIRRALFRAVTANDIKEIVRALVSRARLGDVLACRELLNRLLGRPGIVADEVEGQPDDAPSQIVFTVVPARSDDEDNREAGSG